ncbi:MAG: PilZ domain-containing protein [Phycisphaerae bacterium]
MAGNERRAYRRIPLRMVVEVLTWAELGGAGSGTTRDVSAGGMLIETEARNDIQPGQLMDFVIHYSGQSHARPGPGRILGQGQVVRVEPSDSRRMQVAVHFADQLSMAF